jgi:hypothetical protein
MSFPVKSLSDTIMEPITKAYRVGGFGLAFLLLGALLMLTATLIARGVLSYFLGGAGLVLILLPCYFFYQKEVRPISQAHKAVLENKDMIDAVQATALSMTELTLSLEALAFKHADQVVKALDVARPQIRALPLVGQLADQPALVRADRLSRVIVSTTVSVKEVVTDLRIALISSDPRPLRRHLKNVQDLQSRVTELLASNTYQTEDRS